MNLNIFIDVFCWLPVLMVPVFGHRTLTNWQCCLYYVTPYDLTWYGTQTAVVESRRMPGTAFPVFLLGY
jgi:hypothetical protein